MKTLRTLTSALVVAFVAALLGPAQPAEANDGAWRLQGTDGKTHALADHRGKWLVLEWVNFRCPQVRSLYRERGGAHQTLQESARARGIVWLAVNSSAPGQSGSLDLRQAVSVMKANKAKPTAMVLDPKGVAGRQFKVRLTPEVRVHRSKRSCRLQRRGRESHHAPSRWHAHAAPVPKRGPPGGDGRAGASLRKRAGARLRDSIFAGRWAEWPGGAGFSPCATRMARHVASVSSEDAG